MPARALWCAHAGFAESRERSCRPFLEPVLPQGPGRWYERNFTGHRTVPVHTEDTTTPPCTPGPAGRVPSSHWMDLVTAGMELLRRRSSTAVAVAGRDGRPDLAAAQARVSRGPPGPRWARPAFCSSADVGDSAGINPKRPGIQRAEERNPWGRGSVAAS